MTDLITQLTTHFSPLTLGLFVLIIAEEVVANLPFIQSNSVGAMIMSTTKTILMKIWGEKTSA